MRWANGENTPIQIFKYVLCHTIFSFYFLLFWIQLNRLLFAPQQSFDFLKVSLSLIIQNTIIFFSSFLLLVSIRRFVPWFFDCFFNDFYFLFQKSQMFFFILQFTNRRQKKERNKKKTLIIKISLCFFFFFFFFDFVFLCLHSEDMNHIRILKTPTEFKWTNAEIFYQFLTYTETVFFLSIFLFFFSLCYLLKDTPSVCMKEVFNRILHWFRI